MSARSLRTKLGIATDWLGETEPIHLSSRVHAPQGGGSRGTVNNDLRSFSAGGVDVRSDGIAYSVQVNGEPADWRTFPYTYWTLRAAFRPIDGESEQ